MNYFKNDLAASVAIVGAACRLPGAPDLSSLATLLTRGGDAVTQIPAERWSQDLFYDPFPASPGKSYTFAAGCVDGVDLFDPTFFGISPREAVQMDPQQRLLLELALESLEDAGIRPSMLAGSRTSVHVGGSSSDYVTLRLGDPGGADAYFMTGSSLCSLANRISHTFDLRGASCTVDTACSSSLVALHLAVEGLRACQADVALVGGVNLLLAPQSFVGFSRAAMLSPSGRCHAFDSRADGYVRSEGGGVLVLKRLDTALADGDRIHALICATGTNSDGHTAGFSVPSEAAQAALLGEVYDRAGIAAEDLVYLEAHGTGTPVGDPIEAAAIGSVLGKRRLAPLPIGSVKTNIGHLEAGSGMAGLLKLIIAYRHRQVPASLHLLTPNPAIPFDALNLSLVASPLTLPDRGVLAMGINSFGFGGTNAHAVLCAAPDTDPQPSVSPPPLLLLSARSNGALMQLAGRWQAMLQQPILDIGAMLRGAARQRDHYTHRLAVLGNDAESLSRGIAAYLAEKGSASVIAGTALRRPGRLAFAYCGNGAQWAGMARDAMAHSAIFIAVIDRLDALLVPLLGWSVRHVLLVADAAASRRTEVAQPLLFAVQVATVEALRAHGIVADAHVGHSVGEVAAAWASGALSLEDAVLVIAQRSRLQQHTANNGSMAVLGLGAAAAAAAIAGLPGLCIAAINASKAVTVAGNIDALDHLAAMASRHGWTYLKLDLNHAFHSPAMNPIQEPLLAALAGLAPRPCHTMLASSVTGGQVDGTGLDAAYWWQNVRAPVRFAQAAGALVEKGIGLFLEIGPQAVLHGFLQDAMEVGGAQGTVLPSLTRRPAPTDPILIAAARCHVSGHGIDEGPLFDGPASADGLPHYPWQRERYWFERTSEATDLLHPPASNSLLGFQRNELDAGWFSHVNLVSRPWLADHVVDRSILLPAAAMIDMALAACIASLPDARIHEVRDLAIRRPVVLEAGQGVELTLVLQGGDGRFQMRCRPRLGTEPAEHYATGRMAAGTTERPLGLAETGLNTTAGDALLADAFYPALAALGLKYGPAFRTVHSVCQTGPDSGIIDLTPGHAPGQVVIDPTLLDGALQGLAVLAAACRPGTGPMQVLPFRFGRIRLLGRAAPVRALMKVTLTGPRSICADLLLLDASGSPVLELMDCWFVAIRLASTDAVADRVLRPVQVPGASADEVPFPPPPGGASAELTEPLLLADAFLSSIACKALGPSASADRTDWQCQARTWLVQDGVFRPPGSPQHAGDEPEFILPEPSLLFGSLLFDHPAQAAEAALLAHIGVALPDALRCGLMPLLPAALVDQMLGDSPTALAMLEALDVSIGLILAAWPLGRRLRIVEAGAGTGALTRHLVSRLRCLPGCTFIAVTSDPDERPALLELVAPLPGARVLLAGSAEALALADVDVVTGMHVLARTPQILDMLHASLRPGGVLLLAEPAPSRFWQVLAWAGLAAGNGPLGGARCVQLLVSAGFSAVSVTSIQTPFWPACLVQCRLAAGAQTLRLPQSPLWEWCRSGAEHGFRQVVGFAGLPKIPACTPDWLATLPDDTTPVLLLQRPAFTDTCELVEGIAGLLAWVSGLVQQLSERGGTLVLALRGAVVADPFAAAVQGLRRVLVNEASDLRCRLIRFHPSMDDAQVSERLREELAQDDGEDEVAWSAAGRTVARLHLGSPTTAIAGSAALVVARPGLLSSLVWQAQAPLAPGPGQVLIEVTASGLNFRDVMWALGLLPDEALMRGFAGATLGLECAGRLLAVGAGVEKLVPGMRVMAMAPAALAASCVTAAHAVVPIPDGIDDAQAATMPVAFLTVLYALGTLGQLAKGEHVLIHGGAGGVGLAAIQYARLRGAVIIATAGSPAKRAMLELLGVDHVLDSRTLAFADEVMRITTGRGVDVILNSLSGEAMERSLGLLAPFGRFLELGKRDFYEDKLVGLRPLRHNAIYFSVDADQLPVHRPRLAAQLLAELAALLDAGALRPLPYRCFAHADVQKAFRLMQGSGHVGKIILRPGPQSPPDTVPAYAVRADRTYVLTGALSGFGRRTALWLADQGARHLAVISRRGPADPVAIAFEQDLAARGVRLLVVGCDVADAAAMDVALRQIRARMPRIGGVLHCAMVLDDALLPQLDAERLRTVLRPKLVGAMVLDRLTRDDELEIFVLFSSVVTMLGNPGQASYVAANAAMEAVAEQRHAQGLPALAICWGPIADAGVLARDAAVSERLERRLGTAHMTAQSALSALSALLAIQIPVVAHADVPWLALRAGLPLLKGSFTADLPLDKEIEPSEHDLRGELLQLAPSQACTRVAALLIDQLADILRLAPDRIGADTPLADLGMDSLMAVELRLLMESRFGLSLPLLSLSNGVTPTALAERVVRSLTDTRSGPDEEIDALIVRHEGEAPLPASMREGLRKLQPLDAGT